MLMRLVTLVSVPMDTNTQTPIQLFGQMGNADAGLAREQGDRNENDRYFGI